MASTRPNDWASCQKQRVQPRAVMKPSRSSDPSPEEIPKGLSMRQALTRISAASALTLAAFAASAGAIRADAEMRPTGKGYGVPEDRPGMLQQSDATRDARLAGQIAYHGGPVMTATGGTN